MMHYLIKFDGVLQSGFLVITKIKSAKLCKPVHEITNYCTLIRTWKVWKGRGKVTKLLIIS